MRSWREQSWVKETGRKEKEEWTSGMWFRDRESEGFIYRIVWLSPPCNATTLPAFSLPLPVAVWPYNRPARSKHVPVFVIFSCVFMCGRGAVSETWGVQGWWVNVVLTCSPLAHYQKHKQITQNEPECLWNAAKLLYPLNKCSHLSNATKCALFNQPSELIDADQIKLYINTC